MVFVVTAVEKMSPNKYLMPGAALLLAHKSEACDRANQNLLVRVVYWAHY